MKSLVWASLFLSSSVLADEFIVKLKHEASFSQKEHKFFQPENLNLGIGNFYKVSVPQNKSLKQLEENPDVEYIEPNFSYKHFSLPSDKQFKKQWGLQNTGKNSGTIFFPGKKGLDISAVKAWAITKGNKSIKIAVIDTGVDYNHKDLKNNMMVNTLELNGKGGVDDDGNGYIDDIYGYDFANNDGDPKDDHGHGTHCAGVIGAEHNEIGIAGVMADVQILALKFLKKDGSGTLAGALKSIDYAIKQKVDIMSNSWGGGSKSQSLLEAIKRAEDAGILFVAAAGNNSSDNDYKRTYPANYKAANIIAVGAHDGKGRKASFSNYGKRTVHVFAPGVNIYSTVAKNRYKKMSGTSMATPHVSGVLGLMKANEPNLDFIELKERLVRTTILTEKLKDYSISGHVDAFNSMKNIRNSQ